MFSASELLREEPSLRAEGLIGGAMYYDAHTDDARLTLATLRSAVEAGATFVRDVEVVGTSVTGGRIAGLRCRGVDSGHEMEVVAAGVVNSAGPWVSPVASTASSRPSVRLTKGVHVVVQASTSNALLLTHPADGRVFFVLPWEQATLIGTTDTNYAGEPSACRADAADVRYLLQGSTASVVTTPPEISSVRSSFAGLRTLVEEAGRGPSSVSREYRFHWSQEDGIPGMVSVVGGKLTTHRSLAERLMNEACRAFDLNPPRTGNTHALPLPGAERGDPATYVEMASNDLSRRFRVRPEVAQSLVKRHGSRFVELEPFLKERRWREELPGGPEPILRAEVIHAVRRLAARSAEDFLCRRTHLAYLCGKDLPKVVEAVCAEMGRELGWSAQERLRQARRVIDSVHYVDG